MKAFIVGLPKVELHLHIEGTLEPDMMFALAKRNRINIPYSSPEEVSKAYQFENLQSFLDIYYLGAEVLITEQDFFDLTWAYLLRCQQDNVIHTEIFFDPQTHTERGIAFDTVVNGIHRALVLAKTELGITSGLIMSFLRHLNEASAFITLKQALAHKDKIIAVGLDSSELGNPPKKFARVFTQAIEEGFLTVAHAVRCVEDKKLLADIISKQIALTVCPLSNVKLAVFDNMATHNIVELLRQNVCVTINSDDPAYFGGYMNDNFLAVAKNLQPSKKEIVQFTFNAINSAFVNVEEKCRLTAIINHYIGD